MSKPMITQRVAYLTHVEDLEISGRRFEIQYNSINTMFQAVVDGRRHSNCALRDLRAAICQSVADGAGQDARSRAWLEAELADLEKLIAAGSPDDMFRGITLGERRAIALECLGQLRERERLREGVAACRDALARLPDTCIVERLGFAHELKEHLGRLNAMDAEQTARQAKE